MRSYADKRRLAIATALLADPALVVLDDPGAGIDVPHLQPMLRAIKGWQGRTGATVVLTTHSIEVARSAGDHLLVLRDGKVAGEGDSQELLRGVESLEDFEQRFGTTLSVREADPGRLRSQTRNIDKKAIVLTAVLLAAGIVIICGLLFSGVLDLESGAGAGGSDAHTTHTQTNDKPQLGENGG